VSDRRSVKDKEMAAMLKRLGIKRTTGKCALCNSLVSLKGMYGHIVQCRGVFKKI
jgi:hypothetical protein